LRVTLKRLRLHLVEDMSLFVRELDVDLEPAAVPDKATTQHEQRHAD
jgi:hypothetical protein